LVVLLIRAAVVAIPAPNVAQAGRGGLSGALAVVGGVHRDERGGVAGVVHEARVQPVYGHAAGAIHRQRAVVRATTRA
jgi:hypothetical protein